MYVPMSNDCCNNPSKWGLQQRDFTNPAIGEVVITPQNGGFNNSSDNYVISKRVVITPQNGVFNNKEVCNHP